MEKSEFNFYQDEDELAIGLDLGTTLSCIGVYKNGKVEILKNQKGETITPSVVIINDSNILVGEDTTDFLVKYYDTCIYEIKRLIGKKFSEKSVQKDIEKLPFKIVKSNDDTPLIEINSHGIPIKYSPVEISSFVIKKMINNAEKQLNKKINKLVITVPAYFSDSQRKLTKQAAELVGLKVLRVINEPTAAALAYGFDKTQEINEKILVFDLGGGTFDVSILSVKKDEINPNFKVFEVLGTSGDTQLGGKDFDNKLVDYFLNNHEKKNEIKKDKQCIQKLKINCENIKKRLSIDNKAELFIEKFYDNTPLRESIKRTEFEDICSDLFKKLKISLEDALKNAKLTKEEIHEIILVGGSTRIPKVKEIVRNYFPNSKINDKINPDEAVAFGATLEANKILHNKDNSINNFLLMDITPLSLGTNILNKSEDKKIRDEGDIMSVIIKRGTHIPCSISHKYFTVSDNQTTMKIDIYEGENNFVKYNHLLKQRNISNLKKRPRGKTEVVMTLDIDINGILTVNAKEQSENNDGQSIEPIIIKNDEMTLSDKAMKNLEEKNKKLLEKINNADFSSKLDYSNLKDTLKKYKDAYEESINELEKKDLETNADDNIEENEESEDNRVIYITNFNNTLEEFIDLFDIDNNYDNETMLEKYYLYVKELFQSYIATLKLGLDDDEKKHIIKKFKEYINKFINKSSDYIKYLLELLYHEIIDDKNIDDKKKKKIKIIFYGIVIFVMEKLNEQGIKYIESHKKYCKYHSLICFELSKTYYEKYLSEIKKEILPKKEYVNLNNQKNIFNQYIEDINSGAIVLCYESFKGGYLYGDDLKNISVGSGETNDIKRFLVMGNIEKENEKFKIVLANYERILESIQTSEEYSKNTKKEAVCLTNIIYINKKLGYYKQKIRMLLRYSNRCKFIIEHNPEIKNCEKERWFIEFNNLYEDLKKNEPKDEEFSQIFPQIRKKNSAIFNTIDQKFNKKKENIEFIKFILEKHPYKGYDKDKEQRDFDKYNLGLVNYLLQKYHPDNYSLKGGEEEKLNYCIYHEIERKLNNLYTSV